MAPSSPIQDFAIRILLLINRYIEPLPRREPSIVPLIHNHHTFPSSILDKLIQIFQTTHSYFSSPLTRPMQLSHYDFPYERDVIFDSLGPTFSTQGKGCGYTHITTLDLLPKMIKWAKLATHTNHNSTTIIIITHDD